MTLQRKRLQTKLGLLMAVAVLAHADSSEAGKRFIGLLELPRHPVHLYANPEKAAAVIATVTSLNEIETKEHAEEELSAVVYARSPNGWCQVHQKKNKTPAFGWIAPEEAGRYHSIAELLKNGMTYLTDQWDGRLYQEAAGVTPVPPDALGSVAGVLITSTTMVVSETMDSQTYLANKDRLKSVTFIQNISGMDGIYHLTYRRPFQLSIHEQPAESTPVIGLIDSDAPRNAVRMADSTVSFIANRLAVLERKKDWYKVALARSPEGDFMRTGWIRPEPGQATFEPVTDPAALREIRTKVSGSSIEDIKVQELREIGGVLWAKIQILDGISEDKPRIRTAGWVPVYSATGKLAIDFFTRD